jgi:hypothetical protein
VILAVVGTVLMPKALSIFAMAVSGLLLLFFGLDLTMAFPFGGAHRGMSIFFIVCHCWIVQQ